MLIIAFALELVHFGSWHLAEGDGRFGLKVSAYGPVTKLGPRGWQVAARGPAAAPIPLSGRASALPLGLVVIWFTGNRTRYRTVENLPCLPASAVRKRE